MNSLAPLCRLALLLFLAVPLHAATYTWTGATSALWNEPGNWSPRGFRVR